MHFLRHSATFAALAIVAALPAAGQTAYTWLHTIGTPPHWSDPVRWSPAGPPPVEGRVVIDQVGNYFEGGPVLDIDATITELVLKNGGRMGTIDFNTPHALTVTERTTMIGGLITANDGSVFSLGILANQSNATLTNGATIGAGQNLAAGPGPAVVQWRGANIVRNQGSIGLNPQGVLRDQDTGLDALRGFTQNGGLFAIGGRVYVTLPGFSNFGLLQVATNNDVIPLTRLEIGGAFANYNASTGVLTGGAIEVKGRYGRRAEFAFPGADIRTVAPFTSIYLEGDAAILDSITGENGLRHLGDLGGEFSLANAFGVIPANGVLMHKSGNLNVLTNGFMTVTGDFQQFTGAAVNLGRDSSGNARLTVTGNLTIADRLNLESVLGAEDSVLTSNTDAQLASGSRTGGTGTINAPLITPAGTISPGRIPSTGPRPAKARIDAPEAARKFTPIPGFPAPEVTPEAVEVTTVVPGRIRLQGTVAFASTAKLEIGIAGLAPGTGYSSLVQTGKGGLALAGQLSVALATDYTPFPSDMFEIVTSELLSGEFSNVPDGRRIFTADGRGSFRVLYLSGKGGNKVLLTDFEVSSVTVFTAADPDFPSSWDRPLNWSNGIPGTVVSKAVISAGFYTTAANNYLGLDTFVVRARSSHVMQGGTKAEFLGGVTLEADSTGGTSLDYAGPGTAVLATSRISVLPSEGVGLTEFSGFITGGIRIIQPGTAPAPFTVLVPGRGYVRIGADLTPFRGSTLTFEAQGDSSNVSGSFVLLAGTIGEAIPSPASPTGAAVIFQGGGGLVEVTGANTYTGGTVVRDSILNLGKGNLNLSGGLYADNPTGSATGTGPVLVTSTAGTSSDADNRGVLAGIGRIAGDVVIAGSYFLPGNALNTDTQVGTFALGGNLTLTSGPSFLGPRPTSLRIELDPQNPSPVLRQDLILLTSPTAQVNLAAASLSVGLVSPPRPGQVFRIITAPNAGNAVSGTFTGQPQGSTIIATYGPISFALQVAFGANFVELAHLNPPPTSFDYVRSFYFTIDELFDPAISGPFADPLGTGVPNVLAYALGSDPKHFAFNRLPRSSTRSVAGTPYSVIEIRRAIPLRPDLQYFVAEATDLATGFGAPFDIDAAANVARIVSRTDNADGTETIVVRASAPLSTSGHRFLRFSLNYTP